MSLRLHIDRTSFKDSKNREVTLHGINVAADAKLPFTPSQPSHELKDFFEGDDVSFVGRPFPVEEAPSHFDRLKSWGFNVMRYIFTWEALEHAGPGKYDEAFMQYTIATLRIAKAYGFYVFMDPHQDVWSRFSGGSGAPLWTIYACGLDPKQFGVTEAALVQNLYPEPFEFPKMIWATNYTRLACQTIFTLFWAGRAFAPKAVIDGINIQDYLQGHFIAACKYLARRIQEAGDLDRDVIIAWESMNEPNHGLVGLQDLTVVPSEQKLQKGTSPTAWQAILTGSGRACEIDTWDFGGMGPYKSGSKVIDPHGESTWLSATSYDRKYGWTRDPGWKLDGSCLWANHGVWNPSSDRLLKKDYFAVDPETGKTIDYEYFTNKWYMAHYRQYRDAIRDLFPDTTMFCQPPVLEIPPSLKGTADDDPNMAFAPHWYDGVTLMTKKWNRLWNVDVFGVLRNKYSSPIWAIKIGETAIRNCFRNQMSAIRDEGMAHMGSRPCVLTEFGIPYDMDDGYAYKTGDYDSQIRAMDANWFAIEGSGVGGALWDYTPTNDHRWGDQWNGEDLSIFSLDDPLPPNPTSNPALTPTATSSSASAAAPAQSTNDSTPSLPTKRPLMKTMTNNTASSTKATSSKSYRAAQAFIRPTPLSIHSRLVSNSFTLRPKPVFDVKVDGGVDATREDAPSVMFLPVLHFPEGGMQVEVSGGRWDVCDYSEGGGEEEGLRGMRVLKWWHAGGLQGLKVSGDGRAWRKGLDEGGEGDAESEEGVCGDKGCRAM